MIRHTGTTFARLVNLSQCQTKFTEEFEASLSAITRAIQKGLISFPVRKHEVVLERPHRHSRVLRKAHVFALQFCHPEGAVVDQREPTAGADDHFYEPASVERQLPYLLDAIWNRDVLQRALSEALISDLLQPLWQSNRPEVSAAPERVAL